MVSSEALQKLSNIKQKAEVELSHFQRLQEPVPELFSEKVHQIEVLQNSIQVLGREGGFLLDAQHPVNYKECTCIRMNWGRGRYIKLQSEHTTAFSIVPPPSACP